MVALMVAELIAAALFYIACLLCYIFFGDELVTKFDVKPINDVCICFLFAVHDRCLSVFFFLYLLSGCMLELLLIIEKEKEGHTFARPPCRH